MARLAVVYRKPLSIKFLAPRLSSANLWRLFTYLAIPATTLLLTFVTQGLWRRTNTYLEQPIVDFQDRLLLVLQDQNGQAKCFWTPFEEFNAKWHDKLMMPSVEMDLRDENGDFRPDEVNIRATFRPSNAANFSMAQISTVFYALFFDVRLEQRTWLEMPSTPVFGQVPKPSGSLNELNLFGLLDFVQLRPLPWYAFNLTVPAWSPSIEAAGNSTQNGGLRREENVDIDQELDQLLWQLQLYSVAQNYTLGIGRKVEHWRRRELAPSNGTSEGEEGIFYFNFRARLREQVLVYRTNIWEMLKWAWIQFLSMLVIVHALFRVLSAFFYQNQIFGTIVAVDEAGDERKKLE